MASIDKIVDLIVEELRPKPGAYTVPDDYPYSKVSLSGREVPATMQNVIKAHIGVLKEADRRVGRDRIARKREKAEITQRARAAERRAVARFKRNLRLEQRQPEDWITDSNEAVWWNTLLKAHGSPWRDPRTDFLGLLYVDAAIRLIKKYSGKRPVKTEKGNTHNIALLLRQAVTGKLGSDAALLKPVQELL
jgi:hypothetical protein